MMDARMKKRATVYMSIKVKNDCFRISLRIRLWITRWTYLNNLGNIVKWDIPDIFPLTKLDGCGAELAFQVGAAGKFCKAYT